MTKNKNALIFLLVGFLYLFCPLVLSAQQKATQARPNIIFVLTDDLGWRDLGVYGSTFDETPNLDKLASEGMLFTDAYASCNVCSPSRSSIMTGQYPVHTGITDWITGRQSGGPMPYDKLLPPAFAFQMDSSEVTIAQSLKNAGYATFFAGKWHLGLTERYWPEQEGFDVNKGGWAAGNPKAYGMGGYFSPYHNPRLSDGPKGEFLTDRLTNEAISFIKEKTSKGLPFFVDISFYAVHQPIEAKQEYITKFKEKAHHLGLDTMQQFVKDAAWMKDESGFQERIVQANPVYAALLYSVDENVGRILKLLKQLGIEKNTIIVFSSDNGGLSTSEGSPTSNYPLRYGKGWNYEGGIRVPLIIKWPGVTKGGSISDFPVVNTDFYPTFLQMAGMPLMPEQHKDGVSLAPLLEGKKSIDQPAIYWHYPHYSNQGGGPGAAIRENNWKLVQFYEDNHVELYNLRADIEERRDLSYTLPGRTADMLHLLNLWKKQAGAKMPAINPYYNPDYKELMKKNNENMRQYLSHYDTLFSKEIYDPNVSKDLRDQYDRLYHNKN
ncbi:MAG: sulfatase [Bacillota bacterium]|nr:sulfatase [Bacillota bacterium]